MITGQPKDQSFPSRMVIGHSKCNPRVVPVPRHNFLPACCRLTLREWLTGSRSSSAPLLTTLHARPLAGGAVLLLGDYLLVVPSPGSHQYTELSQCLSSKPRFCQNIGNTKMASTALRPKLINHHFISVISPAAIGIFISNQLLKMASFKGA